MNRSVTKQNKTYFQSFSPVRPHNPGGAGAERLFISVTGTAGPGRRLQQDRPRWETGEGKETSAHRLRPGSQRCSQKQEAVAVSECRVWSHHGARKFSPPSLGR